VSLPVLSRAACASMSTTTTTTRDRGDRYGPMEWAQSRDDDDDDDDGGGGGGGGGDDSDTPDLTSDRAGFDRMWYCKCGRESKVLNCI